MSRPLIAFGLFLVYIAITIQSVRQSASPLHPCNEATGENNCLKPLVSPSDLLVLDLWIFSTKNGAHNFELNSSTNLNSKSNHDGRLHWYKIESCSSFPVQLDQDKNRIDGKNCTIPIPNSSRVRKEVKSQSHRTQPLHAKFVLRRPTNANSEEQMNYIESIISEAYFELTRFVEMKDPAEDVHSSSSVTMVPHYKYGNQHIVLRLVAEYRSYGSPHRSDGIQLQHHFRQNRFFTNFYKPLFYVDENALLYKSHVVLGPPLNSSKYFSQTSMNDTLTGVDSIKSNNDHKQKPPVSLSIRFSIISPERDVINKLINDSLQVAETFLHPLELDEIRYFIRDENLYRFLLTQLISIVHLYLDYLAFRDEVQFYSRKSSMAGVSISSILTNLACSIILFLYLLDGGGTSAIILFTIGGEIVVQGWKVMKIMKPRIHFHGILPIIQLSMGSMSDQSIDHHGNEDADTNDTLDKTRENSYILEIESKTREYDRIAVIYLTLLLYPMIAGMGIYALEYDTFTSYYSWFISNLANAVYTFGFIALCPQLYVNYRLKSVAHLPWKVFIYKLFNTFIDDVFAFLIAMPWKHRIMTLRDDIVFVMFLFQAYLYRVDKARPNEFGYVYEIKSGKKDNNYEQEVQSFEGNDGTQSGKDCEDDEKISVGETNIHDTSLRNTVHKLKNN